VLEVLTGTGLAASAGLNAYIPLLTMGLLARYSDLMDLPSGWQWLSDGWVIGILAVLLAIEVVADKVPVVDHVNDVAQTVVRPTAGGLAFGAGSSSETVTVTDPGAFFSSHQWVPIAAGVVIALVVHGVKAAARPVVNASTAGVGAPVASTAEDFSSVVLSVVAIVLPLLVLIGIVLLIVAAVVIFRRRREKRRTGGVPTGRLFG
jgi:LPXTG-motif cell wall-anchored protein